MKQIVIKTGYDNLKINFTCSEQTKTWDESSYEVGCFPTSRSLRNSNLTREVKMENVETANVKSDKDDQQIINENAVRC